MILRQKHLLAILCTLLLFGSSLFPDTRPNIILVMVDDFGHECVESYGGESYKTPYLTRMSKEGIQFNNAHAQNICTPSRVQIMTGQYNVRNYTRFANLSTSLKTFGHGFKSAGYATCIVGKWQLGGNAETIKKLGFDEHCLWRINGANAERYVSPTLLTNGKGEVFPGEYGPDIQQEFAKSFISKNKNSPFFLYYPMTLPHYPFQPTPDSEEWNPNRIPNFNDPIFFPDMVKYLDKLVGELIKHTIQLGIDDNTLIIFTSDNGTDHRITSIQNGLKINGAKGKMISDATLVPFIARWPDVIKKTLSSCHLVDFSDLYATFIDIAKIPIKLSDAKKLDGASIFPIFLGQNQSIRDHSFCWYMERTDSTNIKYFIQNERYKLHHDGRFIDKLKDRFEKNPMNNEMLKSDLRVLKSYFKEKMDYYSSLRPKRIEFKNGQPIQIPGILEFEMYDIGMPGITYHDVTKGNSDRGFWRRDDVDIKSKNGLHFVTNTEPGEWLEYSIDISRNGEFKTSINYSAKTDGKITFLLEDKIIAEGVRLPKTINSNMVKLNPPEIFRLPKGNHILKIRINQGSLNLDSIQFHN